MQLVMEHRQIWNEDEHKMEPYISHDKYFPLSKFPFVSRDITILNNNSVIEALVGYSGKYLRRIYKIGTHFENITFRIIFQSHFRTLTKKEIDETMNEIYDQCELASRYEYEHWWGY